MRERHWMLYDCEATLFLHEYLTSIYIAGAEWPGSDEKYKSRIIRFPSVRLPMYKIVVWLKLSIDLRRIIENRHDIWISVLNLIIFVNSVLSNRLKHFKAEKNYCTSMYNIFFSFRHKFAVLIAPYNFCLKHFFSVCCTLRVIREKVEVPIWLWG